MMVHKSMHIAAQYLAAAGISLIERRTDDSHTSMCWDPNLMALVGETFNNEKRLRMALDYLNYAMIFTDAFGNVLSVKNLGGSKHRNVISWIQSELDRNGIHGAYTYQFHYTLPYGPVTDDYLYPVLKENEIQQLIQLRTTAQKSLEMVLAGVQGASPVRVWPHHFDTGALISVGAESNGNVNKSIGLGLAIPDDMVGSFYYYVNGWKSGEQVAMKNTPSLSAGEWKSGSWNGAVMGANGAGQDEVVKFLKDSISLIERQL